SGDGVQSNGTRADDHRRTSPTWMANASRRSSPPGEDQRTSSRGFVSGTSMATASLVPTVPSWSTMPTRRTPSLAVREQARTSWKVADVANLLVHDSPVNSLVVHLP